MKTITKQHIANLQTLYDRDEAGDKKFGRIGYLWAPNIALYMIQYDCESLLDYGCGRSGLVGHVKEHMTFDIDIQEYDPVTRPTTPRPADFVSCIDVLEHVEVDFLDAVLADIKRCMKKAALITVSLRERSSKKAAIHPLVRPREFWITNIQLKVGMVNEVPILDLSKSKSEIAMLVTPHE